jgi:hypothetical protein
LARAPSITVCLSAESFYRAAKYIEAAVNEGTLKLSFRIQPIYYLYRHAVELVLKAFLLAIGLSEKEVEKFSHRIADLYEESLQRGLSQDDRELQRLTRRVINLLLTADKDQALRYPKVGTTRLPNTEAIQRVMDSLLSAIRPRCQSDDAQPSPTRSKARDPRIVPHGAGWGIVDPEGRVRPGSFETPELAEKYLPRKPDPL